MDNKVLVLGLYGQSILLNVERFPINGETVFGNLISIEPGGKGYNQAVSISRNGVPVRFVTAVGNDEFGKRLHDDCKNEGIDGSFSITIPENHTAVASVMSDKHALSRVIVSKGACSNFFPKFLSDEVFKGSGIILLQLELPIELALYASLKAKNHKSLVILNPAPAQNLPKELIEAIDIVTPNYVEALKISSCSKNCDVKTVASRMHNMGFKNIIITLGEKGVFVSLSNGEKYRQPAIDVNAVDSTAAGDTFNGALVASLYNGIDIKKSIDYAIVASGICASRKGVMESIPYKSEIQDYINRSAGLF